MVHKLLKSVRYHIARAHDVNFYLKRCCTWFSLKIIRLINAVSLVHILHIKMMVNKKYV